MGKGGGYLVLQLQHLVANKIDRVFLLCIIATSQNLGSTRHPVVVTVDSHSTTHARFQSLHAFTVHHTHSNAVL